MCKLKNINLFRMKNLKLILPLMVIIATLGLQACKKCIVEGDDIYGGEIIPNVIVYPASGYMTSNMNGDYVIDADHNYADRFEVSIDGGEKTAVNYSMYTLLCYPTNATCNANYDRNVTINDTDGTVNYKITVTQCKNCKETRSVENYVLVPKFPSSYVVSFDVTYVDK